MNMRRDSAVLLGVLLFLSALCLAREIRTGTSIVMGYAERLAYSVFSGGPREPVIQTFMNLADPGQEGEKSRAQAIDEILTAEDMAPAPDLVTEEMDCVLVQEAIAWLGVLGAVEAKELVQKYATPPNSSTDPNEVRDEKSALCARWVLALFQIQAAEIKDDEAREAFLMSALSGSLTPEPSRDTCLWVIETLSGNGCEKSLELIRAWCRKNLNTRRECKDTIWVAEEKVRLLKECGSREKAWKQALEGPDWSQREDLREWAVVSLARSNSESTVEILLAYMRNAQERFFRTSEDFPYTVEFVLETQNEEFSTVARHYSRIERVLRLIGFDDDRFAENGVYPHRYFVHS